MITNAPGQVEHLRDEQLPAPAHEPGADTKPRMPFKTSLKLTREQEDALVQHAIDRTKQLEDQLGRKFKEGGTGGGKIHGLRATIENEHSFMGKRERYTLRYYNHVEDRAGKGVESVYDHSNLTASLSQRITMQMIADAIAFFFGQPDDIDWFSSNAVGSEDENASDKIKKHSRWKIDQCGVKTRLIEALEFAFIRGEAAVKVTHQERAQIFKRTASILVVAEKGDPILDANGDYICQGDSFIDELAPPEQPAAAPAENTGILQKLKTLFTGPEPGSTDGVAGTGTTGPGPGQTPNPEPPTPNGGNEMAAAQPQQMVPTGQKILKRDGVTVLPENPIWETREITRKLVTFEGPEAAVIYYKDFLFPENTPDIQTADLIAHLYDMNVMAVAQMFRGQYGEGDAAIADMTAAVERLRDMLNTSNEPKAAAGQPRTDMKETDTRAAVGVPQVLVAETYLTYDADNDGILEEIMLVLDRENEAPIYYEYLANVTTKGQRPIHFIRPMPVDGRAYGMGAMELFDPEQEFVDLQINRHNFRTSDGGMVKFWNPTLTMEGSRDPNLKLNHGQTYTKRDPNTKKEDILDYVELPTDAKALEFLINLFMQLMQMKSGKVNGADRAVSGLPSSDTLGEEELITSSGEELFNRILAHLFPGVKTCLGAVVDVIYANLNRVEVFNYFNGEADEILSLDPADVRDMAINVTLELSRTQARKAQQSGDKATALVTWFYQLPFVLQQRACTYARGQLKGLGVGQADKLIDPVDLSGGAQNKVSESLAYKDAPPDIKRQIEAQAGMTPSTAESAAAQAATPEEAGTQPEPPKTGPAV